MRSQLQSTATLRQAVRQTLAARGLLEVVTPVTVIAPGGEPYLDALPVEFHLLGGSARPAHLRTSPEVWHKKLLAEGSGPIFEIAPCLRDGEGGPWHDLEFEMVEWYRPGEAMEALMEDLQALLDVCFSAMDRRPAPQISRHRVADLFEQHVGVVLDPEQALPDFTAALDSVGIRCADDDDWDDAFFRAWLSRVEPQLASMGAVIVERYPASQAAMARLCDDDDRFCHRFELYVDGIELANAFNELTDGPEQRRRFDAWQAQRRRLGRPDFRADEAFFAAVDRLPPTVGIALGLDRLMALAMGAKDLSPVRPFRLTDLLEAR